MGITGWVRNNDDGSVEGHACGLEKSIEMFEKFLYKGSPNAKVKRVIVMKINEDVNYTEFKIIK